MSKSLPLEWDGSTDLAAELEKAKADRDQLKEKIAKEKGKHSELWGEVNAALRILAEAVYTYKPDWVYLPDVSAMAQSAARILAECAADRDRLAAELEKAATEHGQYVGRVALREEAMEADRDRLAAENADLRERLARLYYQHPVMNLTFDPPLVFDGTPERCELNNRLARTLEERDRLAAIVATFPPDAAGLLQRLGPNVFYPTEQERTDAAAARAWAERLDAAALDTLRRGVICKRSI